MKNTFKIVWIANCTRGSLGISLTQPFLHAVAIIVTILSSVHWWKEAGDKICITELSRHFFYWPWDSTPFVHCISALLWCIALVHCKCEYGEEIRVKFTHAHFTNSTPGNQNDVQNWIVSCNRFWNLISLYEFLS